MSFFEELKRRNVFRVGIAYVLLGWVVMQAADFALDLIDAPNWVIQVFFIAGLLGLPFALFFAWAFELTPEGIKREEDVDRSGSMTPVTGRKLDRAIIVFLALAVVLLLVDRYRGPEPPAGTESVAEVTATDDSAQAADALPDKSVAVLPFADLSRDGDQAWFADGLAEEILNALARTPDLLVASRTSSFSYKDSDKDILEIARELGVAHVLEGSVRSSEDRIRVTAQLIRAEDGFHVWSENYDRSPEDMIAIQEDLARSIAQALETSMDPEELAAMARVGTRSVQAYQAYLRGVASGGANFRENAQILQTLEHYEAATRADPTFAAAYLGQADWWKGQLTPSYIYSGVTGLDVEELMKRFTVAIDAAIENAGGELDRRGYLAQKAEVEVRLGDAKELYESYLRERPNELPALLGYANVARLSSDETATERALLRMQEIGTRDAEAAVFYLSSAYDRADPDEVADYGLDRLEVWPDNRGLLYQTHRALMWAGRAEEGAAILRRYELSFPGSPLMQIRQACIEGRRDDADAAFANLERGDDDRWRTQTWLALKMLGRDDEASRILTPIARSSSPYQLASTLGYAVFDPTPYPELMRIIEREGVLRPPPRDLPYRCPPPDETSIAVLPFVNMSEDQDYFADGISEEILNALARVPDLKVAGRTSSFAFKGRNEDLRTIGEALGVNHILEGSVRKAGDRVRITAQLIKADDGFHLWSDTYDRQLTDVFAIQDEIATAILGELEARLLGDQAPTAVEVDLAVYDDYLHARQLILERKETALEQAATLLDGVIAEAPDYAPAYAQRATAELMLADRPSFYGSRDPMETTETAERLALRALELDADLADAHAALGLAWSNRGQRDKAEKALRRALALNPNHVNANNWLAMDLLADNRLQEARRVRERVVEVDPLYAPGIGNLAFSYQIIGEHARADALIERVMPYVEGSVRDYVRAAAVDARIWDQEEAQAVKLMEELGDRDPWFASFVTAIALMDLGAYERALSYGADRAVGIRALARLGRLEEALSRGREFLSRGEGLEHMIRILSAAERHDEVVELYRSRFDSLDELVAMTEFAGLGADLLGDIALAHRAREDEEAFRAALDAFRVVLELQRSGGANNKYYSWSRAYLAMLQDNREQALDHMERAVDQGFLESPDFTQHWAAFRPLLGEPRLQALVERMSERRNAQRALLDLPRYEAGP